MGFQILNGGAGGGFLAQVNSENQLITRSITQGEILHASVEGNVFSWDSGERDIDAGDTMLFVKNESETLLVLDCLNIVASNVLCLWEINLGSATTTPTGTTVTGVNLNVNFASKVADVTASFDEGAVADGDTIWRGYTQASTTAAGNLNIYIPLYGVILGKGHYIQINQETESTAGSVQLTGYFEDPA